MGLTVLIDLSRFEVGDRGAEQIRIALSRVVAQLKPKTKTRELQMSDAQESLISSIGAAGDEAFDSLLSAEKTVRAAIQSADDVITRAERLKEKMQQQLEILAEARDAIRPLRVQ